MKRINNPKISLFLIFFTVAAFFIGNPDAVADLVIIEGINIQPVEPTDIDIIKIKTYGQVGYICDIELFAYGSTIFGNSISFDFWFNDSNPDGWRLPVIGDWNKILDVGPLSPGTYDVTSVAWMTENFNFSGLRFSDIYSTSITVIPEPSTILLLGFGMLALRKRK